MSSSSNNSNNKNNNDNPVSSSLADCQDALTQIDKDSKEIRGSL